MFPLEEFRESSNPMSWTHSGGGWPDHLVVGSRQRQEAAPSTNNRPRQRSSQGSHFPRPGMPSRIMGNVAYHPIHATPREFNQAKGIANPGHALGVTSASGNSGDQLISRDSRSLGSGP